MPKSPMRLPFAALEWRDGVPLSSEYDDVYFSRDGGLEESRFVFLNGTQFDDTATRKQHIVIGETGFGSGLNFLAAWQRWSELGAPCRLTFISTEANPMRPQDIARAHKHQPDLAAMVQKLVNKLPPPARGFHPRSFENGRVRLILLQGDADESFKNLDGGTGIDLWFLDGFAPAKNQAMWTDGLFDQITRLSAQNARLATFTAAGSVKRALAARGFTVRKTPGFGRKRERIIADYTAGQSPAKPRHPWLPAATLSQASVNVAVIGGGLAGKLVAKDLISRGLSVSLFASSEHKAASEVPAAILAPRFGLDDQPVSDFLSVSFAHALSHSAIRPYFIAPLGLTLVPRDTDDAIRLQKIKADLAWGDEWMRSDDKNLYLPKSGSVNTVAALSSLPAANDHIVKMLSKEKEGWTLTLSDGSKPHFSHIVIAAGMRTPSLIPDWAHVLAARAGQTAAFDAADTAFNAIPKSALSGQGSLSPALGQKRYAGSSFERGDRWPREHAISEICGKLKRMDIAPSNPALDVWYGVRATTPDRLPICGAVCNKRSFDIHIAPLALDAKRKLGEVPVADGRYLLSGLGSKGWQHAPLLAEVIGALIANEPVPMPRETQAALSPMRFAVREVKKKSNQRGPTP